ncbi:MULTISPECIES: hypothetical protein [Flavobacterium]|uniref:hypothetical protein n=1 Tax=Flavobacterium TaxID=237 RepID=UPI00188CFB0A|nr:MULTISPECIES: hypothetical protein [Flavobacterium]MBF4473208.1 hypothetical protein [Flavobacterium sp. HJJ]
MKLLSILLLFTVTANSFTGTNVYICGSAGAKKYHYKESCRGLNACKDQIAKIPLKQAQQNGLTLCGWED